MKAITLIFLLSFLGLVLKAQDTLTLKNGTKVPAKVLEINPTTIKYKHAQNLTGPDYVEEKSNIMVIKYGNGMVDSFHVAKTTQEINATNQPTVTIGKITDAPRKQNAGFHKIKGIADKYYFENENNEVLPRAIGITKISRTAKSLCLQKKVPALEESLRKLRQHKVRQTVFGITGAPLSIIGLGTTIISGIIYSQSSYSYESDPAATGIVIGSIMLTAGISFEVVSIVNGTKKQKRLKEVVDLYNQNL